MVSTRAHSNLEILGTQEKPPQEYDFYRTNEQPMPKTIAIKIVLVQVHRKQERFDLWIA